MSASAPDARGKVTRYEVRDCGGMQVALPVACWRVENPTAPVQVELFAGIVR